MVKAAVLFRELSGTTQLNDESSYRLNEDPEPERNNRIPSPPMLELETRYKQTGYFGAIKQEFLTFIEGTDVKRVLPITTWITQYYNISKGIGDLIAGLTVGMMLIPQGMAYANIAGLPAVYGLYGAIMGLLVCALAGTSRDVSTGVGWSILFSIWKARTQRLERLERDYTFGQWLPEPKYHTRGLEHVWGPISSWMPTLHPTSSSSKSRLRSNLPWRRHSETACKPTRNTFVTIK